VVLVEIVSSLALGDEHGVKLLLNLGIPGHGVKEHLIDEVHRSLDLERVSLLLALNHQCGASYLRRGRNVEEHRLFRYH
jgi:hypothetical protein